MLYNDLYMYNVDTEELPYVPDYFFRVLFKQVSLQTIINIYTHLLCQTSVIIAVEKLEDLVPIH